MKKYILLLLFTATVFAQAQSTSELTAEGKAKIKVTPDIVTLKIEIRKQNEAESEALKEMNIEANKLQIFLIKLGIPPKLIKISEYAVNANRYGNDKKTYIAVVGLSVELKLDKKLLDSFYTELQSGNYKDVNANYVTSLSDGLQKKTHEELVQSAIANARQNADAIAKSLEVKIKGIKSVSKNGKEIFYRGATDNEVYAASYETVPQTVFTKFDVKEKEEEEQITIVYEIGK